MLTAPPPGPGAPVVHRYGDAGLLVDVADTGAALALRDGLRERPPPGLVDLVPAAASLLVRVRPGTDLHAVARAVRAAACAGPGGHRTRAAVEASETVVPVVYDGPDLHEVAALLGLSVPALVAAHTGRPWTVAFIGFAPGFGYLRRDGEAMVVPRRAEPRTSVPGGAVGLAGEFGGVYPRASPGGWQLLGRTDLAVWDLDREPPALLTPGHRVRFVEAGA